MRIIYARVYPLGRSMSVVINLQILISMTASAPLYRFNFYTLTVANKFINQTYTRVLAGTRALLYVRTSRYVVILYSEKAAPSLNASVIIILLEKISHVQISDLAHYQIFITTVLYYINFREAKSRVVNKFCRTSLHFYDFQSDTHLLFNSIRVSSN